VTHTIEKIETNSAKCPDAIKKTDIPTQYPHVWTIGDLDILDNNLLGFFCSVKCPGDIILKTYDLARSFRDAGVTVISGFHSPIEKDFLEILLRGSQPIVICPARGILRIRGPSIWKKAVDDGRLLLLSPFDEKHKWMTVSLAEQRNHFVIQLGKEHFILYATPENKTESLCREVIDSGKKVFTFHSKGQNCLAAAGAIAVEPVEYIMIAK